MNDSKIISCADMITKVADFTPLSNSNELPSVWKKVVSNIGKNENEEEITIGERISSNSHVVDLKNGVLLVEANHSGWIQYLRMYQKFIIKGLNWALPDLKIRNLAFRVSGSEANLSNQYNEMVSKEKEKINKKLENDEKKLETINFENKNEKAESKLPPELLERFELLKKSMKNNDK